MNVLAVLVVVEVVVIVVVVMVLSVVVMIVVVGYWWWFSGCGVGGDSLCKGGSCCICRNIVFALKLRCFVAILKLT